MYGENIQQTHLLKHRIQPFILEGYGDFEQVHNDPEQQFSNVSMPMVDLVK